MGPGARPWLAAWVAAASTWAVPCAPHPPWTRSSAYRCSRCAAQLLPSPSPTHPAAAEQGTEAPECAAARQAGGAAAGGTAYLNLECGDCHGDRAAVDALAGAGVARVVVGMRHPLPHLRGTALAQLRAAGLRVAVLGEAPCGAGVAGEEAEAALDACLAANEALLHRAVIKRPMGLLKYAMTLDGKIATHTGHSAWVSSAQSRQRVFETRARSDAVIVGGCTGAGQGGRGLGRPVRGAGLRGGCLRGGCLPHCHPWRASSPALNAPPRLRHPPAPPPAVRRDNPQLTTRREGGHQPMRIVMSRTLDLPAEAKLWDVSHAPTVVATQRGARRDFQDALRRRGVEVLEFDFLTPDAVARWASFWLVVWCGVVCVCVCVCVLWRR